MTDTEDYTRPLSVYADHGDLLGRDDDDHSLYHTDARGDARYVPIAQTLSNFVFAHAYKTIIQGTWAVEIHDVRVHNHVFNNSSLTINDEIEYDIFSVAGEKTFELRCTTNIYGGIITIYLDDVSQGTIDLYYATDNYNDIKTLAVTVVGTKMHSLKLKVTGKNPSSNNYQAAPVFMRII